MKNKIQKTILGGIVGTAVMTVIMFIAPMMGMPKMNPPAMLAGMLGLPLFLGWIMHFMVGVIFALGYVFLLHNSLKKINTRLVKGALFGLVIFIFAQIMMLMMSRLLGVGASPQGSMILVMIGSIVGHLVYGMVTVIFLEEEK